MRSTMVDGWALWQVPSIQPNDVLDSSLGLNAWPANAQFGYDGPISLPMRLLLAADPEVAKALVSLPASGRLSDVDASNASQVAAVRKLAAELRRMVTEVARDGQSVWKRRLTTVAKNAFQREPTAAEALLIENMVAGLPPDLFRHIEQQWFGGEGRIADRRQPSPAIAARLVSGQDLLGDGNLLAGSDDGLNANALLLNEDSSADELLGIETASGEEDSLLFEVDSGESASPASPPNAKLTKLSGVKHVSLGGWYLDEELLAVRYMPQGHADPLLAAWVQFAVLIEGTKASGSELAGWHDPNFTLGKIVPGGCTECHVLPTESSLDSHSASSSSLLAAWKSIQRPTNAKPFTKFNHSPHLALPMVRDCRYCHIFSDSKNESLGAILKPTDSISASGEIGFIAKRKVTHEYLSGEFADMRQSQCNACHRQDAANAGCTQCHNYHVGTVGLEWSKVIED